MARPSPNNENAQAPAIIPRIENMINFDFPNGWRFMNMRLAKPQTNPINTPKAPPNQSSSPGRSQPFNAEKLRPATMPIDKPAPLVSKNILIRLRLFVGDELFFSILPSDSAQLGLIELRRLSPNLPPR